MRRQGTQTGVLLRRVTRQRDHSDALAANGMLERHLEDAGHLLAVEHVAL